MAGDSDEAKDDFRATLAHVGQHLGNGEHVAIGRFLSVAGLNRYDCGCAEKLGFHEFPFAAQFPWAAGVDFAVVAFANGVVEELIHEALCRREVPATP